MLDNVVQEYKQLARTAHIPKFKESPLEENPTL